MPTESNYIVSCDGGNGGVNAVLAKANGGYKSHYEPSVRAVATGQTLGIAGELEYEYVDWYSNRYVTGDDVIRVTRRGLERHMGANRYGEEFHRFLVAVACAKLGIKEGTVNISLFAPPGLFNDVKQEIVTGFSDSVTIKLKGDKKPRTWIYDTINVYPEGVGAAACFMLDDSGKPQENDAFDGEVVILDAGAYTLDALKMTNGSFNPETLGEATWQNAGVHTHIREPLLRKIHEKGSDFTVVTVDDVDQVIRRGLSGGDYKLKIAGHEFNLEPLCKVLFERYADWVSNNICDGIFGGFNGIKSVILVGGGAVMIEKKLQHLYPGKILDRSKYATTKKLHPADMNAVGGLRITLSKQGQFA